MASTTGIEVGSDSCTLVSVRPGAAGIGQVRALHTISAAEWPADDASRADFLRSIRRTHGLSRRAAVVAWDLPADLDDASAHAALRFVEDAGFRIESILTPPQALACVAGMRRQPGSPDASVWTALNMDGASIAIVGRRELLFARTFRWKYQSGLTGTRAQLLQRYSLIAHLAPEVRHGIELVQASYGLTVDSVVTCGNLPELRSLTMPLIEELELEVETLDSTDGLRAAGRVIPDRLRESASAIRLATAAVLTSNSGHKALRTSAAVAGKDERSGVLRAAAALALIGALAWGAFLIRSIVVPAPVKLMPQPQRSVAGRLAQSRPEIESKRVLSAPANGEPKSTPSSGSKPDQPGPQGAANKSNSTPVSTVLSVRAEPRKSAPAAAPRPAPLPAVELILMDQKRPLAVVDGTVVGVGDLVGARRIFRIERDAVLLREPSGRIVRAPVRRVRD